MNSAKRDLLVLSKNVSTNQKEMDLEVEKLHNLLFHVESLENLCVANEIIDLNKYKIITNPGKLKKILIKNKIKPFEFINNKN